VKRKVNKKYAKVLEEFIVKPLWDTGYLLSPFFTPAYYYVFQKEDENFTSEITILLEDTATDGVKRLQIWFSSNLNLQFSYPVNKIFPLPYHLYEFDLEKPVKEISEQIINVLFPKMLFFRKTLFVTNHDRDELFVNRDYYLDHYKKHCGNLPTSVQELSDHCRKLMAANLDKIDLLLMCASAYVHLIQEQLQGQIRNKKGELLMSTPTRRTIRILMTTFSIFAGDFYHCFNKGVPTCSIRLDGKLELAYDVDKYDETYLEWRSIFNNSTLAK
jgi:hypothetical protein